MQVLHCRLIATIFESKTRPRHNENEAKTSLAFTPHIYSPAHKSSLERPSFCQTITLHTEYDRAFSTTGTYTLQHKLDIVRHTLLINIMQNKVHIGLATMGSEGQPPVVARLTVAKMKCIAYVLVFDLGCLKRNFTLKEARRLQRLNTMDF